MKPADSTVSTKPKLTPEQTLVLRHQTARARGKEQYGKADAAQKELEAKVGVGVPVEMPDGRKFAVVDTFKDAKYAKKMTYIDRLEIQEVK